LVVRSVVLGRHVSFSLMTSRTQGLANTLRAPGRFESRTVLPTGDCFYDCMHMLLPKERPAGLKDAVAMRDTVAQAMTTELLDLYRMYHVAKVEGYEFMRQLATADGGDSLDALRVFARRRGHDAGPGQCLWADEHALRTICTLACVRLLIVDDQATSRGSRSGRRRGDDVGACDGRFVCIGDPSAARFVLLHRSRRAHYSPVLFDGRGTSELTSLPLPTRQLWSLRMDTDTALYSRSDEQEPPQLGVNKRQRTVAAQGAEPMAER